MTAFVVDASVAAKWLFQEQDSDAATRLRQPGHELFAPEFLRIELAAVIWKKVQRGHVALDDARTALAAVATVPVRLEPDASLLSAAFEISAANNHPIYDLLYLALAMREGCSLITADDRLYGALQPAFPKAIVRLSDL